MNGNTLYDIAWDFLVALEAKRREEPSRPVFFVAHSFGGIIIKEMLRRSSGCHRSHTHLRSIFKSTVGIIFFGTPHDGAGSSISLQDTAAKCMRATGSSMNDQVFNALLPSTERLNELRDKFGPMAEEQSWIIHSFQEQEGVAILGDHKASVLNIIHHIAN